MNYYTIYEKLLISLYFLCHLFFCKIRNISLSCKFLGDLLSILRKFAENKPDNLRKLMGRGDGDG